MIDAEEDRGIRPTCEHLVVMGQESRPNPELAVGTVGVGLGLQRPADQLIHHLLGCLTGTRWPLTGVNAIPHRLPLYLG